MNRIQPLSLADPAWNEDAWLKWCDYLSLVEQKVYKALREYSFTHTEVDLQTFAPYIGVSKSALARALERLESVGLLEDMTNA